MTYQKEGPSTPLETTTHLGPLYLKKQDRDFPPDEAFIFARLCASVCLDLVLLLVRWVSVKRITTVSLLYPHTHCLRDLHSQDPLSTAPDPPILCTARLARELHFYLKYKRGKSGTVIDRDSVTGAGREWVTYFPSVPLAKS